MTKRTSTKGTPIDPELTVSRLRHVLDYEPDTGVFRWRVTGSGISRAGAVAGAESNSGGGKRYIKIRVDGKLYFAHRLAWLWTHGAWPDSQIDHIDGDGLNNSMRNLRKSNQTQNLGNTSKRSLSKERYKGITRRGRSWVAQIRCNGVSAYLGMFSTPEAAAAAYDASALERFGEFARTNRGMGLL